MTDHLAPTPRALAGPRHRVTIEPRGSLKGFSKVRWTCGRYLNHIIRRFRSRVKRVARAGPLRFPSYGDRSNAYILAGVPQPNRTEGDPKRADGRAGIDRFNGVQMTWNDDGSFEGWSSNVQIAELEVKGGVLSGRSSGIGCVNPGSPQCTPRGCSGHRRQDREAELRCRLGVGQCKGHVTNRLRHDMRDARQQMVHQRRLSCVLAKLHFDVRRNASRAACLQQQIDENAVSAIGGDASGRGVRLMNVAAFVQLHQHIANGRRRHAQPALPGQDLRRHRLTRFDVLANERGQQAMRTLRELVGTHCETGVTGSYCPNQYRPPRCRRRPIAVEARRESQWYC